jgi:hypothetical protein
MVVVMVMNGVPRNPEAESINPLVAKIQKSIAAIENLHVGKVIFPLGVFVLRR